MQIKEIEKKLCVASNHSGVRGMISANKPLDYLLK